jgi:hypothetical protein
MSLRKINLNEVHEQPYWSPKQTMGGYSRELSLALGRVVLPKRAFMRAEPLDYWDGEE